MPTEIEIKVRCDDLDSVRDRLRTLGASLHSRGLERNRIWDRADGSLRISGCGLRVRQWPHAEPPRSDAVLTFKGPRTPSRLVKMREEIEVACAEPEALCEILRNLGYVELLAFEKKREVWSLPPCEVTLDELPRAGRFVEIEGPDPAALEPLRRGLQLDAAPVVEETYVGLAWALGADENGVRVLRF